MSEKKVAKLIPYEVHYICDECNEGEMLPNGINTYLTNPPQIGHKCTKCGSTKNIANASYPTIIYEREEI